MNRTNPHRCLPIVAAAALLGALGTGCGAPSTVPTADRPDRPVAAERVSRALDRADQAVGSVDEVRTQLRMNPADCLCPPWEARLYGRWVRVAVEDPSNADTDEVAPSEVPAGTVREATIAITQRTVRSDTGWTYRVVRIIPPVP